MSHNFFLKPRRSQIDEARVLDYLRGRPHYEVEGRQAFYDNDVSGVHFQFELNALHDDDPETRDYPYIFQVNYWRPSYFILEAHQEVAAFVHHFDCTLLDLDNENPWKGEYVADRLIDSWNRGNQFSYVAILEQHPDLRETLLTLPTTQLTRNWRWNYTLERLRSQQTQDTFVPRIFLVLVDGEVSTMAVWPDAISSVLPKVDYLRVGRKAFAPPGIAKDDVLLPWQEANQILDRHGSPHPGDAISLDYVDQPPDVAAFVSSLSPRQAEIKGVPMSEVLDRELVEKALAEL